MGEKLPTVLTEGEVEKLFKQVDDLRDRLILNLLYKCGLRVSELCHLKIEDIDFEDEEIKVVQGKGKKDRFVLATRDVLELIKRYVREREEGYLIQSKKRNKISQRQVERIVKKYAKKARLKKEVTPHTLRHTFATELVKNDVEISKVQKLLGHSSISTTQIYTHLVLKDIRRDYERVFG